MNYNTADNRTPIRENAVYDLKDSDKNRSSKETELKTKKTATLLETRKNIQTDNLLGCRYELKYRITEAKARALEQYISAYLYPDRYASLQPDHCYPIVSLYFDSENLKLCRETLEGKKNRFKLRIRGYSDDQRSPLFFEIKRRVNNVILKSRARVRHEDVVYLLSHQVSLPERYKQDENAIRQFKLYVDSLNARPVVLVRYMRQAFEGQGQNKVRITFDRKLGYKPTSEYRVMLNSPGWQNLSMDFVVLEIKFTSRYPAWLREMVKVFDLKISAMSKYASSVKQCSAMGYLGL